MKKCEYNTFKEGCRDGSHALSSDDKRQWAETEYQEYQEALHFCEGDGELAQVGQRGRGVSSFGGLLKLPGSGPGHPTPGVPA